MTPSIKTTAFSLAKGAQLHSDDAYDVKTNHFESIAIVCDGVGSAIGGGEASQKTVSHIMNSFKSRPNSWGIEKSILSFVETINSILYHTSVARYERAEMLTTLAMVVIDKERLYGANVGDSSIYLLRDGTLTKLSKDHVMQEEGFGHVLLKALGLEEKVEPYFFENFIKAGDKILLCSDGLSHILSDDEISKNIVLGAINLVKLASKKVNDNLPDDTTSIILEINELDEASKLKNIDLMIPEYLRIGDKIDGFTLMKSLSENDRTWLCIKEDQEYILKFALYDRDDQSRLLDIFINEAWNARRLKARFFPKAHIPSDRTHRYYVMEKLDGMTLKAYLKKRKLGIEETIRLAQTVLKMGQYLMKFDLVHGDIKPENIIVSFRDGKMVFTIVDFGSIIQVFSVDSKAGTPSYLAPERFEGKPICESSEIYSLGVVLYEALCKKFPYGEIEPFQNPTFNTPKRAKSLNSNIPNWLDNIIHRAISTNINKRYANYSHMLFDLEHSQEVEPYYEVARPLFEMIPVKVAQYGFALMVLLNGILLLKIYQ